MRKEVFEARIDRMEAIMEKTLAEMRADNEKLRSDVKGEIAELREEFNGLRGEFNGLRGEFNGLRGEFNGLRSEMQTALAQYEAIAIETRGEVRALSTHISTMEYWGAFIIGSATIIFGLAQYFQSKRETVAAKVREELNELRKTVLALVEAGKIAAPR